MVFSSRVEMSSREFFEAEAYEQRALGPGVVSCAHAHAQSYSPIKAIQMFVTWQS